MSTNINSTLLKNFIYGMGLGNLSRLEANGLGIDRDDFSEADIDENNYLSVDEILDNDNVYELFATMYVNEQEKAQTADEEKEKEKRTKIQDKNQAGV